MSKRETTKINRDDYELIEDQAWEETVLRQIAEERNLEYSDVVSLLRYTVITYSQLALVTGVREDNLRNLTVARVASGKLRSTLTECNPFPDTKKGKKFVAVDSKCREYILKSIGLDEEGVTKLEESVIAVNQ